MLSRLRGDEWPHVRAAAEVVAAALASGGTIHVFGTGHSHILAEELFYRAGGLVRVSPILVDTLMLHVDAAQSTVLERQPEIADAILIEHPVTSGDVLICASNSGASAVASRLAQLVKPLGVKVVAVTSIRHATSAQARADRDAPAARDRRCGDRQRWRRRRRGGIAVSGTAQAVGPTSTVVGAAIVNAVVVEAVQILVDGGHAPEVYTSSNVAGGDEANARHVQTAKAGS